MSPKNQMKLKEAENPKNDGRTAKSNNGSPSERTSTAVELFEDQFEFIDDVHGQISLNMVERDVVDSPEFQRLFRLSQLGFVDLVYPTANHTRAVHSIGACHLAKTLVDRLNGNNQALEKKGFVGSPKVPQISQVEKILISLGALLHDISHGPFSHDIEKKTHHVFFDEASRNKPIKVRSHYGPYEKHDSYPANPSLYVTLMDTAHSLLARVLRKHSPAFYKLLLAAEDEQPHIKPFIDALARTKWPHVDQEILPTLLFHLLVYEKPEEAEQAPLAFRTSFESSKLEKQGIGPDPSMWAELHRSWYQPFRHDVIGDTLSADLIDYLMRDQSRLGMKGALDDKLLNFYVLVSWSPRTESTAQADVNSVATIWYRSAIDLSDHKRGTFRGERLNDIFRLLDLRHQIHEKAVYHRVVQSAIAMLSRACLILGDKKPPLKVLYGQEAESPALAGDDHFLEKLIAASLDEETRLKRQAGNKADMHRTLIHKLAERRVYRPLMVVPGDRVPLLLRLRYEDSRENLELVLRQLAAIIDSTFFSRFFLLVSKLIESLLQHAIASEDEVYEQLDRLEKDEVGLARACESIPKRVIFWTTPYKQLYKDPGILVRVNDKLTTTVDQLKNEPEISQSLRSRIVTGIGDAETKNEALWKFYVFISDSLFYTGVLAKILRDHPCVKDPRRHEEHLRVAKSLVVRAVTCAWEYWNAKERKIDLNAQASFKQLIDLLRLLQARRISDQIDTSYTKMLDEVSGVQVAQYLHGDDSPKCRDVRYKFDLPSNFEAALKQVINGGSREKVEEAFATLGIDKNHLDMEELVEVLTKLHQNSSRLTELTETAAARNQTFDEGVLRSFWNDLG